MTVSCNAAAAVSRGVPNVNAKWTLKSRKWGVGNVQTLPTWYVNPSEHGLPEWTEITYQKALGVETRHKLLQMAVAHLGTHGVLATHDCLQGARLHTSSTASTADTSSAAVAQGTGSQGGSATSIPAGCSGSAASASSLAAASNLEPTGALVPSASVPGPHTGTSQHDAFLKT